MARLKRHSPQRGEPQRIAAKRTEEAATDTAARAVQTGYRVIAENIERGRDAARKFREGEYNIRDVPRDIEKMSTRMFEAAGEFSVAAIEIGGWLLKAAELAAKQPHDKADNNAVGLTVEFDGPGKTKGKVYTETLNRPKRSTEPKDISVKALDSRAGEGKPISGLRFKADVSVGGVLVAVVTIPDGQSPGVYSGLVYAEGEGVPLGVLTIEVLK